MRELAILSVLFMVSIYLGYTWAESNQEQSERLVNDLFRGLIFIKDFPSIMIFTIVFLNNSVKSLASMLLGVFFGIAPMIFVIFNGILLGIVFDVFSRDLGVWKVTAMLVPHGIIEIPAVLIACSYGLRLGLIMMRKLRGNRVDLRGEFMKALKVYIKYVVPLLLLAAFVETYVTPILSQI